VIAVLWPLAMACSSGSGGQTATGTGETDTSVDTTDTGPADSNADTSATVDTVIGPFEYASSCTFPAAPAQEAGFEMVPAFPNLPGFAAPLMFEMPDDGTNHIYVGERSGVIRRFERRGDVDASSVFLDFRSSVYTSFECGFLGLAFHPDYTNEGRFFTHSCTRTGGRTYSVVTQWNRDAQNPTVADATSAVELLRVEQPFDNHNGGDLAFGPDGRLYASLGDGGSGNDPDNNGQNKNTLLGTIVRIDIDNVDPGMPYGIPSDNPFANGGGRPEIFAWGLRNPWRISFDPVTGQLWVGDVGQGAREEVNIVELGKNYGWKIMEGTQCRPGGPSDCNRDGLTLPVAQYGRDLGVSITGGYVYRGQAVPSLYGAYIYADYGRRNLFTYKHGAEPAPTEPVALTPTLIASFGQDTDGEVYLLGISDGVIYKFVDSTSAASGEVPPETLSETGCFQDLATLTPATGVLAYEMVIPFWSDGADKQRWVVLPDGTQATYSADKRWSFPVGTAFLKHFEVPTDDGTTRLEMRVIVTGVDGAISGYSYRWDASGMDATLLVGADMRSVARPNDPGYTWEFPDRGQCVTCHTAASGGVLGLESGQMADQIAYWDGAGILAAAPTVPVSPYPVLADGAVDANARARAYLHVNCSGCHQPGGKTGVGFDLRIDTVTAAAQICDIFPERGDLGLPAARIVAPGDAAQSVLHERMVRPAFRMPPIGNSRTDPVGSALIQGWIDGGAGCPSGE
jgi:uncharacterized repeat protein (TIGR03806 family)